MSTPNQHTKAREIAQSYNGGIAGQIVQLTNEQKEKLMLDYITSCESRDKEAETLREALRVAKSALESIKEAKDSPPLDLTGDAQFGFYCGVEDVGAQDRYAGADYGYTQGVEAGIEWAMNESTDALSKIAALNPHTNQ